MDKKKSDLKILSIAALIFAGFTAIITVIALLFKDFGAGLPAEEAGMVNTVTKVIFAVIGFVLLALEFFVGYRGLKEVKNPTKGKGHIIAACVLMAISLLGIASPIAAIVNGVDVWGSIGSLCGLIAEAAIYLLYAKAARDLQNAA